MKYFKTVILSGCSCKCLVLATNEFLAHYVKQRIRGVIFGGLQLSHIIVQFNIYQSTSVFIYKDERNFLWHALWLQLNCSVFFYYTDLLAEGAVVTHIKVSL